MSREGSDLPPQAIKDEDTAHPLAAAWRPVFREIVHALVEGDYSLSRNVPCVRPVEPKTASHIRAYVESYGATLIDLPDESWDTTVAQWMRTHWEVLVDLWTAEEGRSDLVLHANVFEVADHFEIDVDCVIVP